MKSHKVQFIVSILIAGVCLYFFVKGMDWDKVRASMTGANYIFVSISCVFTCLSILLRALRWQWFFGKPWISIHKLFLISGIGFMGNGVLPFRMGELVRPFLIWRFTHHKFSTALATIVVERIFDLMGLLLILVFVLYMFPFPTPMAVINNPNLTIADSKTIASVETGSSQTIQEATSALTETDAPPSVISETDPRQFIQKFGFLGFLVFIGLFSAICVMSYAPVWSLRIADRLFKPLPASISSKLLKAIESFELGASSFRSSTAFFYSIVWTMVLWISIAFSELLILWAFKINNVGMIGALFIMLGLCLAVMFPQLPGYIFVYQMAVKLMLVSTFNVEENVAVAAAMVMWLTQVPVVIALGFICLPLMGLSFKDISHVRSEMSASNDDETLEPDESAQT